MTNYKQAIKSNVDIFDNDETFEDLPLESFDKEEAKEILKVMHHQEEMFLGGLNDPLMSTPLGSYKEFREEFEKVGKAWSKLKLKIIHQAGL